MFNCQDPKLTYLNGLGYNVVRLAREGINCLTVLGRDGGSLEDLGSLAAVWKTANPLPQLSGPLAVPDINGSKTEQLKLAVGLEILSGILAGMGGNVANLTPAFSNAKSIQFQFVDVKSFCVKPLEVGNYLRAGDLDLSNDVAKRYFSGPGEAYIITDTLKSNSIQVSASDSSGRQVAVDIPVISTMLGAHAQVEVDTNGSMVFSYHGADLLTFGFKVFQIAFVDGTWTIRGSKPAAALAFDLSADGEQQEPIILKDGGLLTGVKKRSTSVGAK